MPRGATRRQSPDALPRQDFADGANVDFALGAAVAAAVPVGFARLRDDYHFEELDVARRMGISRIKQVGVRFMPPRAMRRVRVTAFPPRRLVTLSLRFFGTGKIIMVDSLQGRIDFRA